MKKKILIIGNGANAYALAKNLSSKHEIYVAPSSDTIAEFATCLDIREDNVNELLEYAMENGIDMTIPVSQIAINADISTIFSNNKQLIFAPSAKANEIVSNKTLAKKVLYKLRIKTPKFGIFEKQNLAFEYIKNQPVPFVIKTNDSNSAAVMTSAMSAKNIIDSTVIDKNKRLIIEDYIHGTPFSFYAITDGYKALPLGSSITYKHSLEGDGGQLTGGMGACVPNYKLSIDDEYFIMDNIVYPLLDYMEISGNTYLGILGVNGILSDDNQIYILGWNSFMQDCDAAPILCSIDDDLYSLFESCIIGSFSDEIDNINLKNEAYVSVVLNCKNKNNAENVINGLDNIDDSTILTFYPTVKKNKYLEFEASYGSVLSVTGSASTLSKSSSLAYSEAEDIDFVGKSYRKDICKINQ